MSAILNGNVKAFAPAPSTCQTWWAHCRLGEHASSHGDELTGDLGPDLEGARPDFPILNGGDVIAAKVKQVVDGIMGLQEPRRLAG